MSRLSAALVIVPITTDDPVIDADSRSDACPGFHHLSAWLLQLTALGLYGIADSQGDYSPSRMRPHDLSLAREHIKRSRSMGLPVRQHVEVGGSSPQVNGRVRDFGWWLPLDPPPPART